MNKDEMESLFEKGDALVNASKSLADAMSFDKPKPQFRGEPPWGVNRTALRRKLIDERAHIYFAQLEEMAEEHNVPPSEVVERKHRMEEWIQECALWKQNESFEDRDMRLTAKREKLFGRDKTTTPTGKPLDGNCCQGGLLRTDKTVMKRRDGAAATTDGLIKTCSVCEKGQRRDAYLRGDKE